jgi:hypothetical protein
MSQPTQMIRPKFYLARRDTRWFKTPTSYVLASETSEQDANAYQLASERPS